jgi:hypothetical protein
MRRHMLTLSIAILCLTACSNTPSYRPVSLPSGKTIRVLSVGPIQFSSGQNALMLRYQTDMKISDQALSKEADEIWSSLRGDAEKGNFRSAIISANEIPTGFIIKQGHSYNFVFEKQDDGTWKSLTKND